MTGTARSVTVATLRGHAAPGLRLSLAMSRQGAARGTPSATGSPAHYPPSTALVVCIRHRPCQTTGRCVRFVVRCLWAGAVHQRPGRAVRIVPAARGPSGLCMGPTSSALEGHGPDAGVSSPETARFSSKRE